MGTNIPRPTKRPPTPQYEPRRFEHFSNCPNCCAVITGPICEYCGTRFPNLQETIGEVVIPLDITQEQAEKAILEWHNNIFRNTN